MHVKWKANNTSKWQRTNFYSITTNVRVSERVRMFGCRCMGQKERIYAKEYAILYPIQIKFSYSEKYIFCVQHMSKSGNG